MRSVGSLMSEAPAAPLTVEVAHRENQPELETAASGDAFDALDEAEALAIEVEHFKVMAARLAAVKAAGGSNLEASATWRCPSESQDEGFGLALSGGGTRAAAFHCGVFWSLAAAGLLKDMRHLCAVSGGGYTASSYVTHVCAAEAPGRGAGGQAIDAWFSEVVANFILRMQTNINYLVDVTPGRCCRRAKEDAPEEVGSSGCPRWLDLPLFIGAVIGSMTASPLLLILQAMWPGVLLMELLHGAMLREAWCGNDNDVKVLFNWFFRSIGFVAAFAGSALVLGLLNKCGACHPTPARHKCYLYLRSLRHVLERSAVCAGVYAALVTIIFVLQISAWGSANHSHRGSEVEEICAAYISKGNSLCSDCSFWSGKPWFNTSLVEATTTERKATMEWPLPRRGWDFLAALSYAIATIPVSGLALAGVGAFLWRSTLLKWLVTLAGPFGFLLLVVHVTRWVVFGPLTGQMLIPWVQWTQYTESFANACLWTFTVGALLTLPIYDAAQKLAHLYYRRALKRAFFSSGQDISFETIVGNPFCPNLLFGACLHEYRKPWEAPNHSEFTMSSLFMGCRRTGFFSTPRQASLARLMTVAGAATDATFLLNADVFAIRFFMAVVALRLGDFLRMRKDTGMVMRLEGRIMHSFESQSLRQRLVPSTGTHDSHWISRWLQGFLDRLPAACCFMFAHVLLLAGATIGRSTVATSFSGCEAYRFLLMSAFVLVAAIIILSFFAFIRPLQFLMRSPMVQQLLMVCMHRHKAVKPPPYLYISDGGLIEVLGILPLLRRRLARIVVSDAAEDPELSMRCLRDAFSFCRKEGLCSFYDFRDPRRDMEFVLRDLRDGTAAHLHLGIRYEGAVPPGGTVDGELFYVRMRLVPGDDSSVRPLITKEELLGVPPPAPAAASGASPGPSDETSQRRADMSGACWPQSECGGLCAGRRFPNFGVSNQFLTPLHFANLCSLGGELSWPLAELMAKGSSARGPQAV